MWTWFSMWFSLCSLSACCLLGLVTFPLWWWRQRDPPKTRKLFTRIDGVSVQKTALLVNTTAWETSECMKVIGSELSMPECILKVTTCNQSNRLNRDYFTRVLHIRWVPGPLSRGIKLPGREAAVSVEVKEVWAYTSIPPTPSLRSA
jgi:hypothetical protein